MVVVHPGVKGASGPGSSPPPLPLNAPDLGNGCEENGLVIGVSGT